MKVSNNILVLGIIVLVMALLLISYKCNFEQFSTQEIITDVETHLKNHPDKELRDQIVSPDDTGSESNNKNNNNKSIDNTLKDYVRITDIERAARASAREYCPVGPDYNQSDYIKNLK